MKRILIALLSIAALSIMGGCAPTTAHAQSAGDYTSTPILDDDKVDVYEIKNNKTGDIIIANSRGGVVVLPSHKDF